MRSDAGRSIFLRVAVPLRERSFWLASAAVAYVAFAALRGGPGPLSVIALIGLFVALGIVWSRTAHDKDLRDDDGARSAARVAATGVAMLAASRVGAPSAGLTALGNMGAGLASIASLVAIARLPSMGGLATPPHDAGRLDAAAFASLLWTIAAALPAARAIARERAEGLPPFASEIATSAASLGSLALLATTALRARAMRRAEIGTFERLGAAALVSAAALVIGVAASAVGVAAPEDALPPASAAASIVIAAAAVSRDPALVPKALRAAIALGLGGSPIALGAAALARTSPSRAAGIAFGAAVIALLIGAAAPSIAMRILPARARRKAALDRAMIASMTPDPDAALDAALAALRTALAPHGSADPALVRLDPLEKVWVDRAGYTHAEPARLPEGVVAIAEGEPARVLRVEAVRAAEVKRPDVRAIAAWMREERVAAIAVVRDESAPVGLLVVPEGGSPAWTFDEVEALRALADRIGAALGVSASLARSRAREMTARAELERVSAEASKLGSARDRDAARLVAIARMLERPARIASYSPAARAAVTELERIGAEGKPVTLLTAPGVDAVAWAALAHLASPRRTGPLAIADGASAAEHDLDRWRSEGSPITEASGGTLVLLDAHALPAEVQRYVAAALAPGTGLIVSVPSTVDALVASGRFDEHLADLLGDRAVALPSLAARSEDLGALALDALARLGLRLRGKPLGLAPKALAALVEHDWPANDAELYATLLRAALAAEGDAIREADLGLSRPIKKRGA